MINHTPWEDNINDGVLVKFIENTETLYTIMMWYQNDKFVVYDKIHTSEDQPLYHQSKIFDDENIATEYAEIQLC